MATGHIPQIFLRITVQNQIRVAQRVVIDSALRHLYSCDLCDTSFLIRFRTHSRLEQAGIIIPEENKKSEPFSYREKVRIFIVWCDGRDSNPRPTDS